MQLRRLTEHLNEYLNLAAFEDRSLNGLQVEGAPEVHRVAFAVDANLAVFQQAAAADVQLLVVHHGLFWGQEAPLTGPLFQRVRCLIEAKVGLYAVHLPLDAHPQVGNNAELARLLGLVGRSTFGDHHGQTIGFAGELPEETTAPELAERLAAALGHPTMRVVDAKRPVRRVACVSGGAADMAAQAAEGGYDTYVTGEVSHGYMPLMTELGLNVVFGGHYATETLGVKALARRLESSLGLKTHFIDLPTGA